MHPTIPEQLRAIGEEIESDRIGATMTQSAVVRLERIAVAWDRIVPFLRWDNAAMEELLGVDGGGAEDDFDLLHDRNKELRGLLSGRIVELAHDRRRASEWRRIEGHLRERLRRDPWRKASR